MCNRPMFGSVARRGRKKEAVTKIARCPTPPVASGTRQHDAAQPVAFGVALDPVTTRELGHGTSIEQRSAGRVSCRTSAGRAHQVPVAPGSVRLSGIRTQSTENEPAGGRGELGPTKQISERDLAETSADEDSGMRLCRANLESSLHP